MLRRNRPRVIVGGFLGLLPAGGVAWDYIQYPLGFSMLGCDVYYIEDTGKWPIYQVGNGGSDCSSNIAYLTRLMDAFGLGSRWAYLDAASGRCFGLAESEVKEVLRTADILVNVSCATYLREAYEKVPVRILVDSDPMFTQVQYCNGSAEVKRIIEAHTHYFTFGENMGASDCLIPSLGFSWSTTRQPICLPYWPVTENPTDNAAPFTTIMNWIAAKKLVFQNQSWGQKDVEFLRFLDLPGKAPSMTLAAAVGQTTGSPFPEEEATRHGWRVMDPQACAGDWIDYQNFIRNSSGEFSVAKETYVKARTGWFSCRSACYLASGRPVVTQETGWSAYIPAGEGLFACQDAEGAAAALHAVSADPHRHRRRARELAEEFFDSDRVLGKMLDEAGV